ncbi:chloramphenicol-sensitive protein RarD [Goodfellowiella coeruleoviolacea]|uniref:Chloramphenicol-sensitive protein RarD n=1 Tax=Goodfellowiella coeruleoviolacea TaxID=334858 RepID=A0AAE3GD57_9PSEU|nr:chloramphenicol-sensitive protein RarD [Goodfellowiella coeruleoviolacea]
MAERTRSDQPAGRSGVLLGTGCYLLWGLFPLFWPLLAPAGPVEVLAHRLLWTLALMLVVATVLGRWRVLRRLPARGWGMVAISAVLITINWGVYIYAVNSGHVVEGALGYFINPLVSIVLGVVVLRERLRRPQLLALVIAAVAVLVLALDYGRVPVIALSLAGSFGLYGLLKKTVPLDPASSLTAESLVIGPLAVAYLVWLGTTGAGTFTTEGAGHVLLLAATGPITAVPLLLFGAAAKRVPLVTLGMLQYLTPVLQFVLGVFVNHEPMPVSRWLGFGLVWTALVVFTAGTYLRRPRRDTTLPTAGGDATGAER